MNATTPNRRGPRPAAGARTAGARTVRAAFAALLAGAVVPPGLVGAAELYRWVESDGSITFSPNRPPAGVDFDTVETGTAGAATASGRATASPVSPVSPVAPASDPAIGPGVEAAAATTVQPAPATPDAPPSARANVSYAPPPLGAAVAGTSGVEGLVAEPGAASADADATARTARGSGDARELPAADSADARRRAQCRELGKRVVSLERSLMIEMPPERMDDTVVSMARYQTSLDDHCRR